MNCQNDPVLSDDEQMFASFMLIYFRGAGADAARKLAASLAEAVSDGLGQGELLRMAVRAASPYISAPTVH